MKDILSKKRKINDNETIALTREFSVVMKKKLPPKHKDPNSFSIPVVDRKKHTPSQKKMYKKHHKIRGSLVLAIPRAEYMKMSDKSTAKAMFASLCANYEGSKCWNKMSLKLPLRVLMIRRY